MINSSIQTMNTVTLMNAINSSNHSGGNVDPVTFTIVLIISLYLLQLLFVWIGLLMNNDNDIFENKKQFWWWNVPFIPLFVLCFNKLKDLK
jgi:hypothetical protein